MVATWANMGKGDAILVVACDLHEEAPLWWLRVRQAAQRGAAVIVANPRPTRTDTFASHINSTMNLAENPPFIISL